MSPDLGLLEMGIPIDLADGLAAGRPGASRTSRRLTGVRHPHLWRLRLAFAITLIVVACLAVTGSLASLVLSRVLAHRRGAVGRGILRLSARLTLQVARLTGLIQCDLPALAEMVGPYGLLLVANHPSRLDALFMIACLPDLVCITKASIWDHRLFGAAIRMAGYPRVGDDRHFASVGALLLDGHRVLVFPEGTRSPTAGPGPFRPGFAVLARQAQVPIQTIMIETDSDFLGRDWPLLRVPARPVRIGLRVGTRFDPPGRQPGDMRRVALAVERAFHEQPADPRRDMPA
ncbi:MAG: lysophospholipid acyltransferase family protein [Janthinobacterium lividum]